MKYRTPSFHRMVPAAPRQRLGFTLVELLVTMSVATILLTMAVPSFSDFIKDNRMVTQTNDFVTALNLARSEAIRRGSRITVCKSSDGATCAASGGWDQGWVVLVDANGDGTVDDAATGILRVHGALNTGATLKGSAALATYISYTSMGTTRAINGGATATQTGTLVLCGDNKFDDKARAIQINVSGRVSSTKANAANSGATTCSP